MARAQKLWQAWGEGDPYYAVLSAPEFGRDKMKAQSLAAFFASGHEYVTRMLAEGERRLGPIARSRALDYGCGVGRVAIALASEFGRVTAADIAPAMLARARSHAAAAARAGNLEFVSTADGRGLTGEFDLVHTYLVLQHVPPRPARRVLRRLAGLVAPGGAAIVHLTCWRRAPWWRRAHSRLRPRLPPYDLLLGALQGRPRHRSIPMYVHNLGCVLSLMDAAGAGDFSLGWTRGPAGFEAATIYFRRGIGFPAGKAAG